jgi:uncharacterized Tic20 family protein
MNEILPIKIRFLAACCHLSGLAWIGDFYLISSNVSHAHPNSDIFNYLLALSVFLFLLPLLIWSFIKNTHDFVDRSGRKALNYHLSILFYIICLFFVAMFSCFVTLGFGSLSGLSSSAYSVRNNDPNFKLISLISQGLWQLVTNPHFLTSIHAIDISIATFYTLKGNIFSYPLTIHFLKNV